MVKHKFVVTAAMADVSISTAHRKEKDKGNICEREPKKPRLYSEEWLVLASKLCPTLLVSGDWNQRTLQMRCVTSWNVSKISNGYCGVGGLMALSKGYRQQETLWHTTDLLCGRDGVEWNQVDLEFTQSELRGMAVNANKGRALEMYSIAVGKVRGVMWQVGDTVRIYGS